MRRGKLFTSLVILLFFFSFIVMVRAQTETSIWRDDMNYSNFAQFQAASWTTNHQSGINFTGSGVILNGTQADTSISYSNKFPSGIYDWKVEDRSRWASGSHSGNNVAVSTENHSYSFAADGWYSNFAFYRDGQKILTFGTYQEKSNEWITLAMQKHGNQIDMYFNNQLENSYTEPDTTPSQLTGYNSINPWQGAAEYDYVQIWSITPSATTTPQTSAGDAWTMFGHDVASARYSTSSAPRTSQILWSSTLDSQIRTSVTILGNHAYVGSFNGVIYALDASTGAKIWNFTTSGAVWSSPAVANGIVYVGSNDWTLYALSATNGTEIWSFKTGGGVFSSPIVVSNVVYVGATDNNVYALDADTGTKIWNYTTDGQVRDSVAVVDGVVYAGSQGGYFYAINAATGTLLWKSPTGDGDTYTNSSPAVVNGVAYVGSTDTNLYAFKTSDGSKVWSFSTNGKVSSSPAVFNGVVYCGSEDGNIYAVDSSSGTKIWSQATGGPVYSSPAIASGIVYVGSWGDTMYAFDAATGTTVWSYKTGGGVFSSPSIAGGVMFIGSYDGKVYAFGSSYSPQSTSNAGTTPTPKPAAAYAGSFTFRGWIDGTDYLYVQAGGAIVWYQHTRSEIPGFEINGAGVQGNIQRHQNLPTYLDGNAWYPSWAGITTSWIDVPAVSDKYTSPASHPQGEWNITSIANVVARGNFSIIDYPSAINNYTAKILLDDILPSGADWYSFAMNWIANGPLTQSASDVTKTAWVPPPANGVAATVVTVGAVSVVALLAAAASSAPAAASTGFLDKLVSELRKLLPDTVKKWMEDFIASKRKLKIDEKTGSPYLPTKPEIIVYSVAVILLTLSFSYVKVTNLNDLLVVLPTFFATSILVALVRTYILTLYARRKGVWTEYKLWYFGVAMFLVSTLAFKAPFSSPTRSVHHSHNFTERLGGFLSTAGLLITLAFGGFFFILLKGGLVLIGGTGLAMCIISAFFDTFPIEPMGGKDIYKYNKALWGGLFIVSLALYVAWLANLL